MPTDIAQIAASTRQDEVLQDEIISAKTVSRGTKWCIAAGTFLCVLGIYALTSPGRIDIVDGEIRFDVAYSLINAGRPFLRDPWVAPLFGVPGRDGYFYAFYGPAGSVVSIPLVWAGLHTAPPTTQTAQFLFSLTSSIFGAAIAPLLFLFYLDLGATTRRAILWTFVSSFATYLWPISNSTFDNAQHAFFVLAAVYLGVLSARKKSSGLAFLAGLMGATTFLYQEYFVVIMPALALSTIAWRRSGSEAERVNSSPGILQRSLATLMRARRETTAFLRSAWEAPGESRSSCNRYLLFMLAFSVGIMIALLYNDMRFGSYLSNGRFKQPYPVFGNPVSGLLTLLISPGKSIFLYSPALVFGLVGIRRLKQKAPMLATVIIATTALLVSFVSCIAFVGGDWCWGPRYLTSLLPLWALAFPASADVSIKRVATIGIVVVSLAVQVLALSVEHQRFFFEQGLEDYFWAQDRWFYMKHSALFSRFGEVASLSEGLPDTARRFTSLPIPEWTTHCLLGPPRQMPRSLAGRWIRNYQIYFLPRPWPLWMSTIPTGMRAVNVGAWIRAFLIMLAAGVGLVGMGLRLESRGTGNVLPVLHDGIQKDAI